MKKGKGGFRVTTKDALAFFHIPFSCPLSEEQPPQQENAERRPLLHGSHYTSSFSLCQPLFAIFFEETFIFCGIFGKIA